MPTCIYCQRADPPCGFTREHVLLAAFGFFRDAPTLPNSVCAECNQYFGDHLDRLLARDSAEAVLRLHHGIKNPAGLHRMFNERVRIRMPDDGSRWGGVMLKFVAPPAGQQAPLVELVLPQVGCERRVGRPPLVTARARIVSTPAESRPWGAESPARTTAAPASTDPPAR